MIKNKPSLYEPFLAGGVTKATTSSIIKYMVIDTHLKSTIFKHISRKALIDTEPDSLGMGLSSPSAHPGGMVPLSMNRAIVGVILGTSVSTKARKLCVGMPSIPGDDPFFIFSSVVRTSS